MVTIKDVAAACGVSPATVSRALNGTLSGQGSGDRIRQVASEMGYRPNAAARALKTNRSGNIGIIYEDVMQHDWFSALIEGLRMEAERKGYDLTFLRRLFDAGADDYRLQAGYRSLDGVVVVQADFDSKRIKALTGGDFPAVLIDHESPECDCVLSDNAHGTAELVRHIHALGHRRVAFVHGTPGVVTDARLSGFYRACTELGLRVPAEWVRTVAFHDAAACAEEILSLTRLPEPPTCVLCPDDFCCLGAMTRLFAEGIRVPEDVSLAGYDGVGFSQMVHPPLTTWRQEADGMARLAIDTLADAIADPEEREPRRLTVAGTLIPGGSVAAVR